MTSALTPTGTAPLRHRDFRLLVTGTATSALGNAITPVALAFAVLDLGGSATELGLVVAEFSFVQVVTTLFGGVLGDRLPRRLLVQGTAFGSALVQATVATTLLTGVATVPLLTVLGAVGGFLSSLSRPSYMAMTRLTVPPEALARAVATRNLANTSASMAGYALAGVLVAAVGPGWAIAVDALTFTVAALCYRGLAIEEAPLDGPRAGLLADLGDGFREVFRHTWLWLMIVMAMVYHLLYGGAQDVLGPVVVGQGIGREAWGFTMGALMAGFVCGNLVALRWRPRRSLYAGGLVLCLTALFPLAMALSSRLEPILAAAFLHGLGLQLYDVFYDLAIQQHVPPEKLSRIYAIDIVGSFVVRPLGLALTGPVSEAVGYTRWLLVVGLAMLAIELLVLASRQVRHLERSA